MICDRTEQIDIREAARQVPALPDAVNFKGEHIAITWTRTRFGGRRPWFLCPSCERRCAIIYRPADQDLWCCRVCGDGRYLSESMSPYDRMHERAWKIRRKLGQRSGGIGMPFPEKPKGMHWKTYGRLFRIAHELECRIARQDARQLRRMGVEV